ncbi:MAG: M28 family peptidase [Kiritimatiellaeota bacterium]|nr:M28 family peptidase [Kiritimatiellota bacterium]
MRFPRTMLTGGKLLGPVLLLGPIAGCGGGRPSLPPPRPAVDGRRAMTLVAEFAALGPRPAGSKGAARAARWIEAACRKTGARTRIEKWQEQTPAGRRTFRNVHAVVPGRLRGRVLVGSHYDTKVLEDAPDFIGANDSCSSTGLLVELVRLLARFEPWPGRTLEFVFFDGEECLEQYDPRDGLYGSRHFADAIRTGGRVSRWRGMVLLDMVGDREFGLTLSPDTPPKLARALFNIAEKQGVRERVGYYTSGTILDDHTPFQRLGIPAIDLIDFEYGPGNAYWHTPADTLDKLAPQSLAIAGDLCLGLVWRLAF